MTVQTLAELTGLAGVIAKYADNDADPYDRATQLAAIAQYLAKHTHGTGFGTPVANLAANVNHSVNGLLNNWQRLVGTYTATAGTAGPDRLFISLAGTDTISCTQDTANRDSANGAKFSLACAFTLGSGGGLSNVQEVFKTTTDTFGFFRGRTITRTWKIKTATANAVRVAMQSDGTGAATLYSGFHTGDGTWQTLSVTYTVPVDATIVYCYVPFNASCTAYLGAHSTVIGSNLVDPYSVALSPADDIARCMRYYEILMMGANEEVGAGQCISATGLQVPVRYAVPKGGVPTVTFSGAAADYSVWNSVGGAVACVTVSVASAQQRTAILGATVAAGLVAGNATSLFGTTVNAKLAAEWNP